MTTDQHRAFAREQAGMIYHYYLERDNLAACDANHIASELSYEETMYRGLLAECDFAAKFGLRVKREIQPHGDGGVDFMLRLFTRQSVEQFPINVKAKSILYGGWEGWQRLATSGTHMRIPVREVRPRTIYVFAIYLVGDDVAECLRWAWGRSLIERNERMTFENGNGEESYTMPFAELRELQELRDRMKPPPGFVGYDDAGHFLHYCKCGKEAGFGHGVSLLKGQLGTWYCGPCNPSPTSNSH